MAEMNDKRGTLVDTIMTIVATADRELLTLDEDELAAQWYWQWRLDRDAAWNMYEFSAMLEMHKRRCRRWEEHHNGNCCVVERVRDKYLIPRVREFLAALAAHEVIGAQDQSGPPR